MGLEKPKLNVGKKFATGKTNTIGVGTFYNASVVNTQLQKIKVTGLGFLPSVILVFRSDGYNVASVYSNSPKVSGNSLARVAVGSGYQIIVGLGDFVLLNGEFTIPIDSTALSDLTWIAYE